MKKVNQDFKYLVMLDQVISLLLPWKQVTSLRSPPTFYMKKWEM